MKSKTYLGAFLGLCAGLSATIVAVNFLVDPYLITGSRRVPHINQHKVDINNYVGTSKAFHPLRQDNDILLIGNSRVEMGISPSHACIMRTEQRAYNLGLPGASLSYQLAYASNLMMQQPIRDVFIGVDFTDFTIADETPPGAAPATTAFSGVPLAYLPDGTRNPDFLSSRLRHYYQALYSLNSLASSLKTILLQTRPNADRDDFGFNPAHDFLRATQVEGPGAIFQQKITRLRQDFSNPQFIRYSNGELAPSFGELREFLEFAVEKDVDVTLFTNPFHEQYWDLLSESGLMGEYADWLGSLSDMLEDLDDRNVALWDFSADSAFIHEPVPEPGVRADPLRWFWEPSHYRKELGDLMLDSMLAERCGTEIVFGERLYPP